MGRNLVKTPTMFLDSDGGQSLERSLAVWAGGVANSCTSLMTLRDDAAHKLGNQPDLLEGRKATHVGPERESAVGVVLKHMTPG